MENEKKFVVRFINAPNAKNRKDHWKLSVNYVNGNGEARPIGQPIFLDEAQVELLHMLGYVHEDLVHLEG